MFPAAILLLLLGWDLSHAQTTAGPGLYRILCYVEGWTHWRSEPVRFQPEDVDTSLCTHLAWNYAGLDSSGTRLTTTDFSDLGMWRMMTNLKNNQPNLKVLLTVGGWSLGSNEFSKMSSKSDSIQAFVDNGIRTLRGSNFDGLVVDWEYPATRGDPPEDKHRLTQLLQVWEWLVNLKPLNRQGKANGTHLEET